MYNNVAQFPTEVWDGSSPARKDVTVYRGPETQDWDQIVAEMQAAQTKILSDAAVLSGVMFNQMPNANGTTLAAGAPVYSKADGSGCGLADANGATVLPYAIGLNIASCVSLAVATIQKRGLLTLTTTQWDAVAGTSGGLVANKEYFVSGTTGVITSTPPATSGDFVLSVGVAVSTTVLNIDLIFRKVVP